MADPASAALADQMEVRLRKIVDPEAIEERAKADQRAKIAALGGTDAVKNAGVFSASPIPGKAAVIEKPA